MLEEFEKTNELPPKILEYMDTLRKSFTKEEYLQQKKESNALEESLFLEKDHKITDYCYIQGEKDIKSCRVTFATLKNKEKKRKLIPLVATFALDTLNFEEVFIKVPPEEVAVIKYLEEKGYENLGEESGNIIFLKEKEEIKEIQRKIA